MAANLIQESPSNIALQMPSKWKIMNEECVKSENSAKDFYKSSPDNSLDWKEVGG